MGWDEGISFDGVDDELIRREKGRARELRIAALGEVIVVEYPCVTGGDQICRTEGRGFSTTSMAARGSGGPPNPVAITVTRISSLRF